MARLKPSDASLLDTKWMRVDVDRTIDAPPERIWAVVGTESRWLEWYRPVSRFLPIGEPTSGVGARFEEHESWWKTTTEIVEKEEGRHLGLATRSINLRGLLRRYYRRIELEPIDDGRSTRVTIVGAFRFGLLGWLLIPFTYPQMQALLWFEYRSALKGLKAALR